MPCVYVETSYLKDLLATLPELPPHNWLITGLDCYDYCGWEGCEKWAERELFLTDEELRRDVDLRNMQIIWGVFSAVPAEYSREEIYCHPLPESENSYYMSSRIVPQHPLALLELCVEDGYSMLVSARNHALLEPFYHLPYKVRDEEARNKVMNAQLRRIQDALRREVPDVSPGVANEVQWKVWKDFFRGNDDRVDDAELHRAVMKEYQAYAAYDMTYSLNKVTLFGDPFFCNNSSKVLFMSLALDFCNRYPTSLPCFGIALTLAISRLDTAFPRVFLIDHELIGNYSDDELKFIDRVIEHIEHSFQSQ